MGFKSIISSKQNILQVYFFSLPFKQFYKLSRSNGFKHVVLRKVTGGVEGRVVGGVGDSVVGASHI